MNLISKEDSGNGGRASFAGKSFGSVVSVHVHSSWVF